MAKALAPRPTRDNDQVARAAGRQVQRQLARQQRKALTHAIHPEWTHENSLRLDLFGDPLSTSGEEAPPRARRAQDTDTVRAGDRQAACLRLAHIATRADSFGWDWR